MALLNSFFYEPFLWLFALAGILLAVRRGLTAFDRFFIAWLGVFLSGRLSAYVTRAGSGRTSGG